MNVYHCLFKSRTEQQKWPSNVSAGTERCGSAGDQCSVFPDPFMLLKDGLRTIMFLRILMLWPRSCVKPSWMTKSEICSSICKLKSPLNQNEKILFATRICNATCISCWL